jgi:hypothetical protein
MRRESFSILLSKNTMRDSTQFAKQNLEIKHINQVLTRTSTGLNVSALFICQMVERRCYKKETIV